MDNFCGLWIVMLWTSVIHRNGLLCPHDTPNSSTAIHRFVHRCAYSSYRLLSLPLRVRLAGISAAVLLLDAARQFGHLVVGGAALRHLGADLAIGVHDCCVIPATKVLTDLRK